MRPTLFIGLGTTGTEILKHLRRFLFEELDVAGLPISHYLAIETDDSENGLDPELPEVPGPTGRYQNIEMLHATVSDVRGLLRKVDLEHGDYDPYVADWLEPQLLEMGEDQYTAGASNIRMAGRLCLWENWLHLQGSQGGPGIGTRIQQLYAQLTSVNNRREAARLLNAYHKRKGDGKTETAAGLGQGPAVYIVGTLCGGTCGGMLMDVAQAVYAYWKGSDIYGVFTMLDANRTEVEEYDVFADNNYAALHELDYGMDPGTKYVRAWPGYPNRGGECFDSPFKYVQLISPTGKDPVGTFYNEVGGLDEQGINKMVAMYIFADVIGGAGGALDRIRTNFTSVSGFYEPKDPANDNYYQRRFAAFGMSGFWYPKYRVAGAAACLLGQRDILGQWLADTALTEKMNQEAQAFWMGDGVRPGAYSQEVQVLTRPEGMRAIGDQLREWLDVYRDVVAKQRRGTALRNVLRAFPQEVERYSGEPLWNLVAEDGRFHREMRDQRGRLRDGLERAIQEQIISRVNQLWPYEQRALQDVEIFLGALDRTIDEQVQEMTAVAPSSELDKDVDQAIRLWEDARGLRRVAAEDGLAWLVGRKKDLLYSHRDLVDRCEEAVCTAFSEQVMGTIEQLQEYVARSVVIEVREQVVVPLRDMLARWRAGMRNVADRFDRSYGNLVIPPQQMNMRVIAPNADNDLRVDAERVAETVRADGSVSAVLQALVGGSSLYGFLDQTLPVEEGEESTLYEALNGAYQREALKKIASVDVTELVQRNLSDSIVDYAQRSVPYQQFNKSVYKPFHLPSGNEPDLLIGPKLSTLETLERQLGGQKYRFHHLYATLDHMLLFYQEEAGYAVCDLEVWKNLEFYYNQCPGKFAPHTHKDPVVFSRPTLEQIEKELRQWITVALTLPVPGVFEGRGREQRMSYRDGGVTKYFDPFDSLAIREAAKDPKGVLTILRGRTQEAMEDLGKKECSRRVDRYLDWYKEGKPDRSGRLAMNKPTTDQYNKEASFYAAVMAGIFPLPGEEGGAPSAEDGEAEFVSLAPPGAEEDISPGDRETGPVEKEMEEGYTSSAPPGAEEEEGSTGKPVGGQRRHRISGSAQADEGGTGSSGKEVGGKRRQWSEDTAQEESASYREQEEEQQGPGAEVTDEQPESPTGEGERSEQPLDSEKKGIDEGKKAAKEEEKLKGEPKDAEEQEENARLDYF